MVGHGGSSASSYLADLTSPIPSHCVSIVATSTLRVNVIITAIVRCITVNFDYFSKTASRSTDYVVEPTTSEKTPLLESGHTSRYGQADEVPAPKKQKGSPSLFIALSKVYGLTLFRAHLCKLVCDLLTFVGPTLQRYVQTMDRGRQ